MADVWWYVGFGAGAAASFALKSYLDKNHHVKLLKDMKVYEVGSPEILYEISKSPEKLVDLAGLTGIVKSSGAAMKSDGHHDLKCVIREVKRIEHSKYWSNFSRSWQDEKRTVSETILTVPFGIGCKTKTSNKSSFVCVDEPLTAAILDLIKINASYEEVQSSLMENLLAVASGEKVKGIETIERVLPVNTTILAVGKLKETNGKLTISSPEILGSKYILTTSSIKTLIESQEKSRQFAKGAVVFFSIIAMSCLTYKLYNWLKRWIQDFRLRRETKRLEKVNCDEDAFCVVCLINKRNVVILNCGHVAACSACLSQVSFCPICRSEIVKLIPIFCP